MSRMLGLVLAMTMLSGCLEVGPRYVYLFQDGNRFSNDVLDYSPAGKYMAIHAKGRPGWYVLKFEAPEGKFKEEFTTESGSLQAWYLPPIGMNREKNPDEVFAPDLGLFAEDPEAPLFAGRAVKLSGSIKAEGKGPEVTGMTLELASSDSPEASLKGKLRGDKHFVALRIPSGG